MLATSATFSPVLLIIIEIILIIFRKRNICMWKEMPGYFYNVHLSTRFTMACFFFISFWSFAARLFCSHSLSRHQVFFFSLLASHNFYGRNSELLFCNLFFPRKFLVSSRFHADLGWKELGSFSGVEGFLRNKNSGSFLRKKLYWVFYAKSFTVIF